MRICNTSAIVRKLQMPMISHETFETYLDVIACLGHKKSYIKYTDAHYRYVYISFGQKQ